MIQPIKAGDPRRSLALGQVYRDLIDLNHRLDIISEIPFNVPVILTTKWTIQGFERSYISIFIVDVLDMGPNNLSCLIYASNRTTITLNIDKVTNIMTLPIIERTIVQWRLLDSTFLGTTINYPMKTSEYSKLFNMEL
jgi:hypothetical protein